MEKPKPKPESGKLRLACPNNPCHRMAHMGGRAYGCFQCGITVRVMDGPLSLPPVYSHPMWGCAC